MRLVRGDPSSAFGPDLLGWCESVARPADLGEQCEDLSSTPQKSPIEELTGEIGHHESAILSPSHLIEVVLNLVIGPSELNQVLDHQFPAAERARLIAHSRSAGLV
jgi:hypothetical protein